MLKGGRKVLLLGDPKNSRLDSFGKQPRLPWPTLILFFVFDLREYEY